MSATLQPYTIYALGETAITIDFGNVINSHINKLVQTIFNKFKQLDFPFILDIVPAYSSLSVYYDIRQVLYHAKENNTAFDTMHVLLENVVSSIQVVQEKAPRHLNIPVCYATDYGPDITILSSNKGLTIEEVIRIHTSTLYRVYMIGFLPGFPYMGEVDERIALPRKTQPRLKVAKGSVGIAGKQTGIYPQTSPGGWQIIGRTPLSLFDPESVTPTLLQPGDYVKFYSITKNEFTHYKSRTV